MPPADPAETHAFDPPASVGDAATVGFAPTAAPAPTGPFAGYELGEVLGRGGMGIVYKARQPGLNRTVALKMMLGGAHANPVERLRFLTEAEVIGNLVHPHVVPVFAFGTHDGQPYYAMEYLSGGSLGDRIKTQPLSPKDAAALVQKLARAVHAAHLKGVIHRDLKPGNVLFAEDGTPKVVDFGLARQVASELTATQAVMGTPSYMAPEQAAGRARDVGPGTDIYALGAILYATLTGKPPFDGESAHATIERVKNDEPAAPRSLNGSIPRDLETVCLKCLRKEPGGRYESAEALAEDLRRYLAGESIAARPVTRTERVVRWARRKPAQAGLVAAVALLLAVGGAAKVMWSLWREAETQRGVSMTLLGEMTDEQNRTVYALAGETRAVRAAEAANERLEHVTAFNRVVLAHREWQAGDVGSALQELAAVPLARRDWEWDYVNKLCHGESRLVRFPDHVNPLVLAVSPNGTFAAVGVSLNKQTPTGVDAAVIGYEVRVINLNTCEVEGSFPVPELISKLTFDPTGRWIATTEALAGAAFQSELVVRDWRTKARVGKATISQAALVTEFDPADSGRIFVRGVMDPLRAYRVAEGRETKRESPPFLPEGMGDDRHSVTYFKVAPTGKRAVAAALGGLYAWDVADPAKMTRTDFDAGTAFPRLSSLILARFEINRDGTLLAFGQLNGSVAVLRTTDWKVFPRLALHTPAVNYCAFDGKNRLVTAGAADTAVQVWDPETGQLKDVYRGHTATINGLAVRHSTGEVVTVALDRTLRIWPATGTAEARTARFDTSRRSANIFLSTTPIWSRDLSTLAFRDSAAPSSGVRVWDAASGKPKGRVIPGDVFPPPVLASPAAENIRPLRDLFSSSRLSTDGTVLTPMPFQGTGPTAVIRLVRFDSSTGRAIDSGRAIVIDDPQCTREFLTPDGSRLAVETNRADRVGDLTTPTPARGAGRRPGVRYGDG